MNILKYKGYAGSADLDLDRGVCRGKILFINDVITYESPTPALLKQGFQAALDDYLQTCEELGRQPQKPLRGAFNVRVSPELHKAASLRAIADGVSLNDVVVRALGAFVFTHHLHEHKAPLSAAPGSRRPVAAGKANSPINPPRKASKAS